jgi:hypothetical protein
LSSCTICSFSRRVELQEWVNVYFSRNFAPHYGRTFVDVDSSLRSFSFAFTRQPSPSLYTSVITVAPLSDPTVVHSHSPTLITNDIACKLLSDVPWRQGSKDKTLICLLVSELRIIVTKNTTQLPGSDYNVTITSSYIVVLRQQWSVSWSSVI